MESIVLLAIRLILAFIFFVEARHKFRDIKGFAKKDSLPLPLAIFVATAELAAALSMLSGVLAVWAGIGLVLLMIIAIGLHIFKWHSKYWASKGGWEYDLLILILAGTIAVFGAGAFALPALV